VFPAAIAAGLVTLLLLPRGAAPGMTLSYTRFLADVSAGTVRAVTISPAGQVTGSLALVYHFHTVAPPRGWSATAGTGIYIPLVADPLRLLVPAGHPLAGRPAASLAEVAGERWIHGWGDVGDATDMLAALRAHAPLG
jgi:hypothetical protein